MKVQNAVLACTLSLLGCVIARIQKNGTDASAGLVGPNQRMRPSPPSAHQVYLRGFSQETLLSPNYHVLALAPFAYSTVGGALTVSQKALVEARKANTINTWLGFPRVAYPDITPCLGEDTAKSCKICDGSEVLKENQDFICCDVSGTCVTSFQAAVYDLVNNPKGGLKTADTWSWNGPATGGTVISVFGMGFGWNGQKCSESCLLTPSRTEDCGPLTSFPCTYVKVSVGITTADQSSVTWFSDSAINFKLPPGQGADVDIKVAAMQYQLSAFLDGIFSYDAPTIYKVIPANAPPSGRTVLTVLGQNFGSDPSTFSTGQIQIGQTVCKAVVWTSDSAITCQSLVPGTGAFNDISVSVMAPFDSSIARKSVVPFTKAFSYDKPVITAIFPNNGPPSTNGLTTVITILGQNFGVGPQVAPRTENGCPQNLPVGCSFQRSGALACTSYYLFSSEVLGVLAPTITPQPSRCAYGFSEKFSVKATAQTNVFWNNIRPHSLAYDPVGCVLNAYICDEYQQLCKYIPDSCKTVSNITVKKEAAQQKWCIVQFGKDIEDAQQAAQSCKLARTTATYLPDGVNCLSQNLTASNKYLCSLSPHLPTDCPQCLGVGCCNNRGTTGTRVGTEPPYGLGGTECVTLQWISDSSLRCRIPPGIGRAHTIMVAIDDDRSQQLAVLPVTFSYDAPETRLILSQPFNPLGGSLLTIQGSNFGPFQCNSTWCSFEPIEFCLPDGCNPPTERSLSCCLLPKSAGVGLAADYGNGGRGYSICQNTKWFSDTTISCTVGPGVGDQRVLEVTIFRSQLHNTDMTRFVVGFEAPIAQRIEPSKMPAAEQGILTISGHNFGKWDTSPKARLAGTACVTTAWRSDSSMLCKVPSGLYASQCGAKECCTPSGGCVFANPCESCANGGFGSGWNFNTNRPSTETACQWPYDTFQPTPETASVQNYQGICGSVVITVNLMRSQLTKVFSYQQPQITKLTPSNGPTTGKQNITISGVNFGTQSDNGYKVAIGETGCTPFTWTSDSSLLCGLQRGYNPGQATKLNIAKNGIQMVEIELLFSFDSPVVSKLHPTSLPTSGDVPLTIYGSNFGAFDQFAIPRILPPFPPQSRIGDTLCLLTKWFSDSALVCKLTGAFEYRGPGVGGQEFVSYKAPTVVLSSSGNGPAAGGKKILINGDNFGVYDYTPEVKIGVTDCSFSSWVSNTAIMCISSACTTYLAGANQELPIQVQLGMSNRQGSAQSGTLPNYFTYDEIVLVPYSLTDIEANVLAYCIAIMTAGVIILIIHARVGSRSTFKQELAALPDRYARTTPSRQENIRPNIALITPQIKKDEDDDGDFYEFEAVKEHDDPEHGKDDMDEAFRRGMSAVMGMDRGRRNWTTDDQDGEDAALLSGDAEAVGSSAAFWKKDVATGRKVLHFPQENVKPTGTIEIANDLDLVDTPAPKRYSKPV